MHSEPKFTHVHCEHCVFLGPDNGHDLYFCPQPSLGMPTVIARYGDDGRDYKSGLPLADVDPELGYARARAREKGLLPPAP